MSINNPDLFVFFPLFEVCPSFLLMQKLKKFKMLQGTVEFFIALFILRLPKKSQLFTFLSSVLFHRMK